ncbi:hypothetical protein C0995_006514, partial [Termitomyces sp. Mi166
TPPYVPENVHFSSVDGQALHGPDGEQFGAEKHYVTVIPFPGSVVHPPGQGIWFSHTPAGLVV